MPHSDKSIKWEIDRFEELTLDKLYKILHLRADIFVVEQNCPYLDPDFKDQKARHLQGYAGDRLIAYCRLFGKGDYFEQASIGRVVVANDCRKYGYGHQMMDKAIELIREQFDETRLTISAQLYLKAFYESHGFVQVGESYLEDDIPHIRMEKK